jgi:spore germination protein KC
MGRLMRFAIVWMFVPVLLTGCWDIKNIQDINYLTAIGIDYADHQYIVYAQMIDFATVAKTEAGKTSQPSQVWIGKGKGETLLSAFNDLYETSQLRIFYGQISAVVYSESLMNPKALEELLDFHSRYYEMRFTPWVFGSQTPIDKILSTTPFFNFSPLMSMLHQPFESYKQKSIIRPLTLREFISNLREPGKTTLLPTLSINDSKWQSGGKARPMLDQNGVFVLHDNKLKGWFEENSIFGVRWTEPHTNRSPLVVRSDGEPQTVLSLENPKVKIHPQITNEKTTYTLHVQLSGNISEIIQTITEAEMEKQAAKQIREEIIQTYKEGLKFNADLLQLEYALYRQKNKEWKKLRGRGELELTPESLSNITVDVKLDHSGKNKAIN